MTADEIKHQFAMEGLTVSDWARRHGYDRNAVYRVLNGLTKAKFGQAHEIAVRLGMKPRVTARFK
ncbi:MAG: hypothetical protein AMXMBFR78_34060 [Rubrivivax sp.]